MKQSHGTSSNLPPTVIVGHSGKQHAYRHAASLQRTGSLKAFLTSGYYKPSGFPDRLFSKSQRLSAYLQRRHLPELDQERVIRRWSLEVPEVLARAVLPRSGIPDQLVRWRDAAFDRWAARRWAHQADIYWGFQGSCLLSMRAARQAGNVAVAEFATAHVTCAIKLLSREAEQHPDWADSISNLYFPDWYRERLEQEPLVADYCVAASEFTRQSLLEAGVAGEQVKLLPLGADLSDFQYRKRSETDPFRILFVGGVGQRKGIKYLLEAYKQMRSSSTELIVAGPQAGSGKAFKEYRDLYTYLGRLDQSDVVREMHRCHVLVLPSVFEGFGLVIPEAMASGMPVIASTHTAGPEIIRQGEDGFVLAPNDVNGLAAQLAWLASHRGQAVAMGYAASRRAHEFSWDSHALRVVKLLEGLGSSRSTCHLQQLCPTGN
jgi:starch synthase